MKKTLLYLGYVGFENLGDEVCFAAFLQWAKRLEPLVDIRCCDLRNPRPIARIHSETPLGGVMLGGGSLLQGTTFVKPALEAVNLGVPLFMFGTGIDYMTEAYARLLADDAQPDVPPQMFDGKELRLDALSAIVSGCRSAGVRGPLTERFLNLIGGGGKASVIGDPGMIYEPEEDASMLRDYPISERRFAAVNWGGTFNSLFGCNEQRTMMGVVDGIRGLILRGYKILIYAMWPNDLAPCRSLWQAVGCPDDCMLVRRLYPIDAICTMLKHASFSVGFKLHAGVLSANAGTPFLSLAYRSKCLDFALSVGSLAYCVSTGSVSIPQAILGFESGLRDGARAVKEQYLSRRAAFKQRYDELLAAVTEAVSESENRLADD